tara:strand:+ start:272 stop:715 length:444 start_codon:yes stop_codon:yes gene_type:complete
MEEAIRLSYENVKSKNGGPFGAVIVSSDNKIVGKGVNSVTSNFDPTAHAEVVAIREACKNLKTPFLNNCTIYTSCEPCPMCYGAIRWAKINKIFYANTREDAKKIGFDDDSIYNEIINRKQNMTKLDNDNAIKSFHLWNNDENKIEY